MRRCSAVACLWLLAAVAQADDMDPALARLRIPSGEAGCPDAGPYCPDQELFEKLASELAVGLTSPVLMAAHTDGPRGFYVGISSVVTTLSGDEAHWIRGSEGQAGDPDLNDSPSTFMLWNRLHVRKGLPFGLELGGSVGSGADTSLWSIGGQLKVAIVEGFRSGYGALPDVSIRASWDFMVGSSQLAATVTSFDVVISKPLLVGSGWSVAPLLGGQLSIATITSDLIDLTPGDSSFDACRPLPGSFAEQGAGESLVCVGDAADEANTVRFQDVTHARLRFTLGAAAEYEWLRLAASLMFDFPGLAPGLDTSRRDFGSDRVASHAAMALSVGVAY